MIVIPLRTMASILVMLIPLGLSSNLLAEATPPIKNNALDDNTIDAEFSSVITNRVAMTTEIIDQLREEAEAKGFEGWENELTSILNNASDEVFLAAYNAKKSYSTVILALTGSSLNKEKLVRDYRNGGTPVISAKSSPSIAGKLGSANKDLVYTPFTPCRIISTTRAGGKILAGTSRSFNAHGGGGRLRDQGGDLSGCRPNGGREAYAYLLNITVHQASGRGHIRIYPEADSNTITSIVNFIPGYAVANSSIVTTSYGIGKDFKIYSSTDVHVIVDVMGSFDKPERTKPDFRIVKTVRAPSKTKYFTFTSPSCPSGYQLVSGGVYTSHYGTSIVNSFPWTSAGNKWGCAINNPNEINITSTCYANCLSIPGK